jgi:hypothetical protein
MRLFRSQSQQERRETDPFRKRRGWWAEPGAIILFLVLVVSGVFIELFALDLEYTNVVIIFGVFWCIMTVLAVSFYRRSQYEVGVYVKDDILERTKEDLLRQRTKVHDDFLETELAVLERGERTTVFDSWRLQPAIQKSHPYFPKMELAAIDASIRELHLRVQLDHQQTSIVGSRGFEATVLAHVLRFLRLLSGDAQFSILGKFFDGIILELYALREDDAGRDISYPFFSLLIAKANLLKLVSSGHITLAQLQKLSDVRFDGGKEIEPHRHMQPGAAQRGK